MKHDQNDQLALTHSHGTQRNAKPVWTMQCDLEELRHMYKMSIGDLMVTLLMFYYDLDHNHAKVDIIPYLSIQLNVKRGIKDICVQNETL